MSLTESNLEQAFKTYFDEMDKCEFPDCLRGPAWAEGEVTVPMMERLD
jgi:hypothetical protein